MEVTDMMYDLAEQFKTLREEKRKLNSASRKSTPRWTMWNTVSPP